MCGNELRTSIMRALRGARSGFRLLKCCARDKLLGWRLGATITWHFKAWICCRGGGFRV